MGRDFRKYNDDHNKLGKKRGIKRWVKMMHRLKNRIKKWNIIESGDKRKEKKLFSIKWYLLIGFLAGGTLSFFCQIRVKADLVDEIQSVGTVIYEAPEGNGPSFHSSDLRWLASEIERQNEEAEELAELCR